jgi:hypothetical protein
MLVDFFLIYYEHLFICLRMWFCIFSILTNLINNKASMQRVGDGCQWDFWLPWDLINKQAETFGFQQQQK